MAKGMVKKGNAHRKKKGKNEKNKRRDWWTRKLISDEQKRQTFLLKDCQRTALV